MGENKRHCRTCGLDKDESEFHIKPKYKCKACVSLARAEYYECNKERIIQRSTKWRKDHPERSRELTKRWRDNHKGYINAHYATHKEKWDGYHVKYRSKPDNIVKLATRSKLRDAVRAGKIVKPECCSQCGEVVSKKCLHAHHLDYSKPYDVEWLCPQCHADAHRLLEAV